ncbi:hypothetical protein V2J09_004994 [Rumex salicifolius]
MGTHLQHLLRSLCWNTEWNYAVFWKLRSRARMVLTWEDAYYDSHVNHGHFESKYSRTIGSLHDGHFPRDFLSLALAHMSYHVYPLGEGFVGQVAVTGKHQWIFADELAVNSLSSSEHFDGWQAQLLAGVQTIVVAAVIPYGVVQLGSLSKVNEDSKHLSHIRDIFSRIQDSSAVRVSNPMQQSLQTLLHMPDVSYSVDTLHGCLLDPAKDVTKKNSYVPLQKQGGDFHGAILPAHIWEAVGLVGNSGIVSSISENVENSIFVQSVNQNEESEVNAVQNVTSASQSNVAGSQNSYDAIISTTKLGVKGKCCSPAQSLDYTLLQGVGKNLASPAEYNCLDVLTSSFNRSAGSELHEALGPAFLKQSVPSWIEVEKSEPITVSDIADGMEQSMLTSDTGTDHLLEAVVANFCHKDSTFKRVKSFSSADSLLTTEKMPDPSSNTSHTVGSGCYSVGCSSILEESIQNCLNSNGFSSSSPILCKDQSFKPIEPAKGNKKRAKPGENCRPRPRDRQLIQDRIKELRDLVPNGSKCSIDSLLERTIKHMFFLQSISKHADTLSNCARSRVHKDAGSSYEQGASWAVEVGGHMKICPIVVENLNMNGQLLIEMLCEDCDHFLEIAEAIRGLGMTILKGTTEIQGDKTWIRFVVEVSETLPPGHIAQRTEMDMKICRGRTTGKCIGWMSCGHSSRYCKRKLLSKWACCWFPVEFSSFFFL